MGGGERAKKANDNTEDERPAGGVKNTLIGPTG